MFAEDARKFISAFQKPITESAPHIYLSALPFSPSTSMVSRQYKTQFPRTLHVLDGQQRYWSAELNILQGHDDWVTSVAFSPDGKHIASGSYDKTIRVWDAETGQIVSGPFTGHDHPVISVAFSPDGKHIASGSQDKTIRVWDAETGQIVSGPFTGHDHSVPSLTSSHIEKH